ncbi:MAG: sulfate ABC transporter substrate-binding protein [Acetobacteraceae bacterium]
MSYDPTRELYADINKAFVADWKTRTGETLSVRASHGGSGAQARAVIEGLQADVVTLALQSDIDAIADRAHLLSPDWRDKLPNRSVPTPRPSCSWCARATQRTSTDWADLVKPGVSVITPNPKTSGGARWNYLAAWGYALRAPGGSPATAKAFVTELYHHVPILDSGARGSTITFAQRNQGDVLIAWEDDANLAVHEIGAGQLEIVVPSVTIEAEPVVAVVDSVVDRRNSRKEAEAYLRFLYTPQGQEIAATHYYRPIDPGGAGAAQGLVPGGAHLHRGRGVRRLAQGAGGAIRRRRHFRPDLPAVEVTPSAGPGRFAPAQATRIILLDRPSP